jgi:hypothetical protein
LGTTEIKVSSTSPASYKIMNLPPGRVSRFSSDKLSEVSEVILLGESASNVIDVEMFLPNSGSYVVTDVIGASDSSD